MSDKSTWRLPARIVISCHIGLVGLSLLILSYWLAFFTFAAVTSRGTGPVLLGVALVITFTILVAVLILELHFTIVLFKHHTGKEVDKEAALKKCKVWLVIEFMVLMVQSGSFLHFAFPLGWVAIVNGILRGGFILVVIGYARELKSEIAAQRNLECSGLLEPEPVQIEVEGN